MQFPNPPRYLAGSAEGVDGEPGAPAVLHDHRLVLALADPGLRRLCRCATGLSPRAQWRLEAVAEALRSTEIDGDPRTRQSPGTSFW